MNSVKTPGAPASGTPGNTYSIPGTSGTTCPICGQWITPGSFHNCQMSYPATPQYQYIYHQSVSDPKLIEAIDKLTEKITQLLEYIIAEGKKI